MVESERLRRAAGRLSQAVGRVDRWSTVAILLLAYTALRLALVPADAAATHGFTHDSAYLVQVAQNVVDGRGYVNDALWFPFLAPESLPIPYHNGNPLQIALASALARATGASVSQIGFLLSATAGGLLVLALTWAAFRFTGSPLQAAFLGFAGSLFPGAIDWSFIHGTDALFVALLFGTFAFLVRLEAAWAVVGAGVSFGLCWLTRSQAILALPAIGLYAVLRSGWRAGGLRFAALLAVAIAIASPWLVHTAQVWGSPLRSDSRYALLQDFLVEEHREAYGGSVRRYWHELDEPPPLLGVVAEKPLALTIFALEGLRNELLALAETWTRGSALAGFLLALAVLPALLDRRLRRSPELLAAACLAATVLGVFALRRDTIEVRYLGAVSVLVGLLAACGTRTAFGGLFAAGDARARVMRWAAAAAVALWVLVVPYNAWRQYRTLTWPARWHVDYRDVARAVDREYAHGGAVITGDVPYFYTLATGSPALSIPHASDERLLAYMDRYGARYLLLTDEELAFWRPAWRVPENLPPGLAAVPSFERGFLFERVEPPVR